MMGVLDRFLDAREVWKAAHGHYPDRVYVSGATLARLLRELSAFRLQDVPMIGKPTGVVGWAGGCDWHEDAAMGDGFRFERRRREVVE